MTAPLCDAHTHNPARRQGVLRVYNLKSEEWNAPLPFAPFCAGIHPQELGSELPQDRLKTLDIILKTQGAAALGECGFDRLASAPMKLQTALFLAQAEMAERLGLPVVAHCVRAFPEAMTARRKLKAKAPWIIHGFRGNAQTARELVRHGFLLSFGAALLQDIPTLQEALRATPKDAILLETDEEPIDIERVYDAFSKASGHDASTPSENFRRIFDAYL